jgi:outer membrane protein assembly factor BamD (BamD/ComL family)
VDELAMSLFAQDDVKASCDADQLPDEARAAYDEGVRMLNAHKFSQATRSLQRVLELEPGSMMALLMLGSVYAQTNRPEDAAQAYMMFVTQCPHHPRTNEIRELLGASGVEGF